MRILVAITAASAALAGSRAAFAQVDQNEPSPYASDPGEANFAEEADPEAAALEAQAAAAAAARAQTEKRIGVGAGQTLGGIRGAEIEVYAFDDFMFDGHLSVYSFSPASGESQTVIAAAAGLFYRWRIHENVALMLGGRLDLGHSSGSEYRYVPGGEYTEGSSGSTQVNLEAPLRAEVYFADRLSIHGEVGAVLAFIGEGGGVLGDSWVGTPKGTYLVTGGTDLLGTIGFTLYLD